ncbi:MAG: PQQ-dependent sugar dehydrogenase, partial [Bacteroidota bacterium]
MRGLVFFCFCLSLNYSGSAQSSLDFAESTIRGPWSLPVGICFDDNSQGYIWDMTGKVYVMDTLDRIQRNPLIDISEQMAKWLDIGMTGFALDPNFLENGYFYLMYPVDWHHYTQFGTSAYDPRKTETNTATFGRISRFTADPTTNFTSIIEGSEHIVLGHSPEDGFPILFDSHGLGSLAFGTDGTLLASCGDGANSVWKDIGGNGGSYFEKGLERGIIKTEENVGAFRAQMIQSLAGKIIRIDPETGAGIASNPFYENDHPKSASSRVWTLGLRNPFRFLIIPESGSHYAEDGQPGTILCGDVGEYSWEELNRFDQGGQNAGWPLYEGMERSPTYGEIELAHPFATNAQQDGDCLQAKFNFNELIAADNQAKILPDHPCFEGNTLATSTPTFVHHRPQLIYQNQDSKGNTTPYAAIATYDTNGEAAITSIDASQADPIGEAFQGDACIPAFYYQEGNLPEDLHYSLFQVDYVGWLRSYQFDTGDKLLKTQQFWEGPDRMVAAAAHPSEPNIYFLSMATRRLHKLTFGGKRPPRATIRADQYFGTSPLTIAFDGKASIAFESDLEYTWKIDGVSVSKDSILSYTFTNKNLTEAQVQLIVRDTFGGIDSVSQSIFINNTPPVIEWLSPDQNAQYPLGASSLVRLDAMAVDAESEHHTLQYDWEIFLHHNTHFHFANAQSGQRSFAILSPLGCNVEEYSYRIVLTVSDEQGLSSQETRWLYPNCNDHTSPTFALDGFAKGQQIDLSWDFELGEQVSYYEVERSQDYFNFALIAQQRTPNFQDILSNAGDYIYRIKAISEDGRFWYSNLLEKSFPAENTLKVYPNPSRGIFNFEWSEIAGRVVQIELLDANGRKIKSLSFEKDITSEQVFRVDLSNWSPGMYFYQIKDQQQCL